MEWLKKSKTWSAIQHKATRKDASVCVCIDAKFNIGVYGCFE